MLSIPSNAFALHLEKIVERSIAQDGCDLRAPIQNRWGGAMGSSTLMLQVIATWARAHPGNARLHLTRAFGTDQGTRARFASTLPGMAALYFSDSVSCDGQEIDRLGALAEVTPRVQAMEVGDFRNTLRGQGIGLVSFVGARNEYLSPLYSAKKEVREISDFEVLVPRMIQSVSPGSLRDIKAWQIEYLSTLVYQLFFNSEEHGTLEATGERSRKGIRGIALRFTTANDLRSLAEDSLGDVALHRYLAKVVTNRRTTASSSSEDRKNTAPIRFFEITVFDTGIGMALHWLTRKHRAEAYSDVSLAEEMQAVRECFEKHATTKASKYSGEGLSMAISAMSKLKAFMTLRCGRLSVYQDFAKKETTELEVANRFEQAQLPAVRGTGFSICIPVF